VYGQKRHPSTKRPSPTSLADAAYEAIKEEIISGKLPPGALILEQEWAARLQMSRTPVREGVKKLEHEHLARRIGQRGVLVSERSVEEFLEICEIRSLLEGYAARVAADKVNLQDLGKFAEEFAALDVPTPTDEMVQRASRVDREFHQLILDAAGNQQLIVIMSRLNDMINRLRFALTPTRYHESLHEHRVILDALRGRDAETAQLAMERHIEAVRRSLHLIRQQPGTRMEHSA
jgi:DNA-binding GntR family transcriptional regulator